MRGRYHGLSLPIGGPFPAAASAHHPMCAGSAGRRQPSSGPRRLGTPDPSNAAVSNGEMDAQMPGKVLRRAVRSIRNRVGAAVGCLIERKAFAGAVRFVPHGSVHESEPGLGAEKMSN